MGVPRQFRVEIYVDVHDEVLLQKLAESRYLQDNPGPPKELVLKEWYEMRKSQEIVCADLQMIFDPGVSPPGTQIQECVVTELNIMPAYLKELEEKPLPPIAPGDAPNS